MNTDDILRGTGSGQRDWSDVEKSINTLPDTPAQTPTIETPYEAQYNGSQAPPQGGIIAEIPIIGGNNMVFTAQTWEALGGLAVGLATEAPELLEEFEALVSKALGKKPASSAPAATPK